MEERSTEAAPKRSLRLPVPQRRRLWRPAGQLAVRQRVRTAPTPARQAFPTIDLRQRMDPAPGTTLCQTAPSLSSPNVRVWAGAIREEERTASTAESAWVVLTCTGRLVDGRRRIVSVIVRETVTGTGRGRETASVMDAEAGVVTSLGATPHHTVTVEEGSRPATLVMLPATHPVRPLVMPRVSRLGNRAEASGSPPRTRVHRLLRLGSLVRRRASRTRAASRSAIVSVRPLIASVVSRRSRSQECILTV